MRIRKRPAFVPSCPPPIQSPDLSSERGEELGGQHPWSSSQRGERAEQLHSHLHPAEDHQELELCSVLPCFNPRVLSQDLKGSHHSHLSFANGSKSSGAPPSPASKRAATIHSELCESADSNETNGWKRRGGASTLTEGSRCSRVNGRGWRCGKLTLVGYSLCEHHLGRGRLRSTASMRRPTYKAGVGEKMETKTDTKKGIGAAKARSITSLLGNGKSTVPFPAIPVPPHHGGEVRWCCESDENK